MLTFTPARTARAGRPAFINYDDLYVLEFAERHGGSVLSGDRFDDIAKEHSYKFLLVLMFFSFECLVSITSSSVVWSNE